MTKQLSHPKFEGLCNIRCITTEQVVVGVRVCSRRLALKAPHFTRAYPKSQLTQQSSLARCTLCWSTLESFGHNMDDYGAASSADANYNDAHRALLQAFLSQPVMPVDDLRPLVAEISAAHGKHAIRDTRL